MAKRDYRIKSDNDEIGRDYPIKLGNDVRLLGNDAFFNKRFC